MSSDDTNDRGNHGPDGPRTDDQSRGIHVDVGLGIFSGLLDDLLDAADRSAGGTPMSPGHRRTPGARKRRQESVEATSDQKRTDRGRTSQSDDHLIETRIDDDEFIVTADIPGATRDDLSVGIRPRTNALQIARDGTVLRRIDIPWASPEATRVWFNNGVLEVRLQPSDT